VEWARRIRRWAEGREPPDPDRITDRKPPARRRRDVFVYFDNDGDAHAPHDAAALREMLGPGPLYRQASPHAQL